MKVRDLMRTDFISFTPKTTYEDAVKMLFESNFHGAPVVNEEKELVGYVSEKDLFRILYPYYKSFYEHPEDYASGESREEKAKEIRYHKVETFMTKSPFTVDPEMPVMNAGALMLAHRIHQFPVVENGKVVGVICRDIIYKNVFKKNFQLS